MTDNVVRLDGGERLVLNEPDPEVIECLQGLLDEARTGKLKTIALAGISSDGFIRVCWRGQSPATHVLGALRRLEFDMLRAIEEDERK